jgi:hypothetical protein
MGKPRAVIDTYYNSLTQNENSKSCGRLLVKRRVTGDPVDRLPCPDFSHVEHVSFARLRERVPRTRLGPLRPGAVSCISGRCSPRRWRGIGSRSGSSLRSVSGSRSGGHRTCATCGGAGTKGSSWWIVQANRGIRGPAVDRSIAGRASVSGHCADAFLADRDPPSS